MSTAERGRFRTLNVRNLPRSHKTVHMGLTRHLVAGARPLWTVKAQPAPSSSPNPRRERLPLTLTKTFAAGVRFQKTPAVKIFEIFVAENLQFLVEIADGCPVATLRWTDSLKGRASRGASRRN